MLSESGLACTSSVGSLFILRFRMSALTWKPQYHWQSVAFNTSNIPPLFVSERSTCLPCCAVPSTIELLPFQRQWELLPVQRRTQRMSTRWPWQLRLRYWQQHRHSESNQPAPIPPLSNGPLQELQELQESQQRLLIQQLVQQLVAIGQASIAVLPGIWAGAKDPPATLSTLEEKTEELQALGVAICAKISMQTAKGSRVQSENLTSRRL